MFPVLPAFAGYVPDELIEKYPNVSYSISQAWNGFRHPIGQVRLLEPVDPLFKKIGSMFIQEQLYPLFKRYISDFLNGHRLLRLYFSLLQWRFIHGNGGKS